MVGTSSFLVEGAYWTREAGAWDGGAEARDCLALPQSIWAQQLGEPGIFHAPKLTDLYRTPELSGDLLERVLG